MTDESVVVDNGQTYVSEETAVVATEAANRAKQWAQESERQANIATSNADTAVNAKDDAVNAVNGFTQRVTEATNTFNSNATAKTNDFNTNATNKTTAFNNNASSKTTDFNNNATAKTTAFNNNYTEKKALIDAQVAIAESSATNANNYKNKAREWAISQNVVDNEDYSSKYWAEKSKEWAESVSSPVNKNLSNLNPQGQNIANWSTNVTNCITEIPQDIKLEPNNDGTLKLKSGSKVYISTNGTFNAVTISNDVSGAGSLWTTAHSRSIFVVVNANNNNLATIPVEQTYSQDTAPTTFLANQYGGWFDTANNIVKYTEDGGTTWRVCSLPICIGRPGETNVGWNGYLDQVFNGFGYIGSTVFALPGVKGLIPNGRNADGSLKNIEVVTNTVKTYNPTAEARTNIHLFMGIIGNLFRAVKYEYDEINNYNLNYGDINYTVDCGIFSTDSSGKITAFTPKTAFHALDYNDSSTISGWAMPSSMYVDLTLGASGATYKAPVNGYICLDKAGTQNEYIDIRNNTTGLLRSKITISAPGTESIAVYMPCKKGDEIAVVYTATGTTNRFRFIYAEGENV